MSLSLNQVQIVGNVGKDPEVKYNTAGDPIASFSVAASEKWKDKSGKDQERTEWFNVTAFGPLAKIIQDILTKGARVFVQGSLRTEEWTDKDGQKRRTTKVILSGPRATFLLLSPKKDKPSEAQGDGGFQATDDDVPFGLTALIPTLLPLAGMATLIGGLA